MAIVVAAMPTPTAISPGSFAATNASDGDRFFSVSGSFARSWIDSLQKETERIDPEDPADLWSWGGFPKGKTMQDGMLVDINLTRKANNYSDWLGGSRSQEPMLVNNPTYGRSNQWVLPF